VGFAVHTAIAFFLTPFVLASLGEVRYGVWALVIGLTGYYGILDLGFRQGMTQYMTRYLAARDFEQLNRTASTTWVALACCSVLVAIATLFFAAFAPLIFDIRADAVSETRWCILINGLSMAVQFLYYPFATVFVATQRYDLGSAIGVGTRVFTAAATVAALLGGFGLIGVSVVHALGSQLDYAVRWRVAYRILPELRVTPRLASRRSLWEVVSFGGWGFLLQSGERLISSTAPVIIGLFMPVAAIASYALARGLSYRIYGLFVPIAQVFYPAATHLDARGDRQGLARLYLAGSKFLLLLAVAAVVIAVLLARDFYQLWVGQMLSEDTLSTVVVLFYLLIAATALRAAQGVGNHVFYATRKLRQLGVLVLLEGLVSLALVVSLISALGLLGVGLGLLVPAAVFQAIVHPMLVCHLLGLGKWAYVRQVYVRPAVAGVAMTAILLPASRLAAPAESWAWLFLYGLVGAAVTLPCIRRNEGGSSPVRCPDWRRAGFPGDPRFPCRSSTR